jgi:predicted DNA-binding transcriptional regulator YafY
VLKGGFDLPPLMFTQEEIEALVLGARIVRSWADPALAEAAEDVLAKVAAVLPARLRTYMDETPLDAPGRHFAEPVAVDLAGLRRAVRGRLKLAFTYRDGTGIATHRTVRPLLISFFGPVWTLTCWCELRQDFRTFRLDRVTELNVLDQAFRPEPGRTLHDYLKGMD